MDGAVGAYVGALPALDELALVDNAFAVHDGHRALGTVSYTHLREKHAPRSGALPASRRPP